jgi:outer membrane protein TolC
LAPTRQGFHVGQRGAAVRSAAVNKHLAIDRLRALGLALVCGASWVHPARAGDNPVNSMPDPMLMAPPEAPRTIRSWDEALSLIRATAPDYISGAEAVRRANAQREVALAAVLPTVVAQGGYTHQFLSPFRSTLAAIRGNPNANPPALVPASVESPPEDNLSVGATLSWSILNPRGIYGVGTASRRIEEAHLAYEEVRRQVAVAAVDAMLATLATRRVAELNRVGLQAALDRLALTRARVAYGQAPAVDVDRASLDVAASRETLIRGDESLRQAREALGVLLGSTTPIAPPETVDLASFATAVSRTCRVNDDLERRPDVRAARKRLEIAERGVTDAELIFSPTVTVASTVQDNTAPVLGPNTTWSATALVTLPIYDGGERYGTLHDRSAAVEQARQELQKVRLDAIVSSARAIRGVSVAERTRDTAREQRDLAARIDERTRDAYSKGLGTSLDLVISGQALRQAEIDLAIVEFQLEDARAHAVLVNAECVY